MDVDTAHHLTQRHEVDAAVRRWLIGGREVLHIEGAPGSGKTAWVKMLVAEGEARDECGRLLARVAAHHFCRHNDARSASAIVFLERIGSQLVQLEPRFARALAERSGRRRGVDIRVSQDLRGSSGASAVGVHIGELSVQSLSLADLLDELLGPLDEILAEPGPDWLIAVDAPDEPSETGVADLLSQLGEMPKRLRWIITSRPATTLARQLAAARAERMDLSVVAAGSPSLT
jgi:hypothetical protein